MASTKSSESVPAASQPSTTARPLPIFVLAYSRLIVGFTSILAPALLSSLAQIPITPYTTTFIRIIGMRDAVIGEHLWFATRAGISPSPSTAAAVGGKQENGELRRHILANMAVDASEAALLALLCAQGVVSARFAVAGGMGSLSLLALGAVALRSL